MTRSASCAGASPHTVTLVLDTALWLTTLGVVVRASGAVKEILFAGAFGVSRATDVFVLVLTYVTFLPSVVGGAIGTALVAYLANTMESLKLASRTCLSLALWIGISGVLCAFVLGLFAPLFKVIRTPRSEVCVKNPQSSRVLKVS